MRKDRRACVVATLVFSAVTGAPALIQTAFELRRGERPRACDVFYQAPTAVNLHAYEHGLEETSLVVKAVRPWVQYAEWKFLDDTGENAVVGRQGWLFYRPSVRYWVERKTGSLVSGSAEVLVAIQSFRDDLQARGVRLLVVPVPNKESVYPEMLAERARGAGVVVCAETRRLFEELMERGIEYVDLFEVFRGARQTESRSDPSRLYRAQDSHWSPEGAQLAAAAVARHVLDAGAVNRGRRDYIERLVSVERHGDLVLMLRVPQIESAIQPERLNCRQVVERDTEVPYRDASESEVLVLGDSFLRVYQEDEPGAAGFIAHVARHLGQPLSAVINDGGGSTLVRQALARRPMLLANKKLVIWEFAERDIRYGTEGWQIVPLANPARDSR